MKSPGESIAPYGVLANLMGTLVPLVEGLTLALMSHEHKLFCHCS